MENIHIVNNTDADPVLIKYALENKEEFADIFSFTVLQGYNPDGSDRIIVDWGE